MDNEQQETDVPELTLYTVKGCPGCMRAKIELVDKIHDGAIGIADVTKDEEMIEFLSDKFGGVPTLVSRDGENICEHDIFTGEVVDCVIDEVMKRRLSEKPPE